MNPVAPDVRRLEAELRTALSGEVRFDAGSRALNATDASNYRQVPIGVVVPRSVDDVVAAVAICHRHGAPVLSRGAGTSLCGQTCNVAVVLDFSKYLNRVLAIDAAAKTARVEPGVILDELRDQAKRQGLTFAPDPATHTHNTLGGMIGNNSCGPHSVMGGETVRNIIELDVLTYDGTRMTVGAGGVLHQQDGGRGNAIVAALRALCACHAGQIRARFPPIPRRVSGYNLNALLPENGFNLAHALVGSEGSCVVVLGATVRLLDNPPARALLVLGYPSVYEAGDDVPEVMRSAPIALEGFDDLLIDDMRAMDLHRRSVALLPPGAGWLLVEYGGADREQACARARSLMEVLDQRARPPSMSLFDDCQRQEALWRVRDATLGATAHVPNKKLTWEGWEDSAVAPEKLGDYLRQLRALLDRYGYECDLYGHFGQGCVHVRIDFDLETAAGIAHYRKFIHEAAHLVVGFGGSVSGEHGGGQSKAELLPIMFGEQLMDAFRDFKRIWDPDWKMNPGKVIDAHGADQDLRLGPSYNPPVLPVHFHYPDDGGDFARTQLRCVGVGECRKKSGTMCPSYMATGEEMHSTRGRARLLFEMMQGEVIKDGWRSEAVHEALDLCLSCKACKNECPVKVDMATYKAEFMAHYYQGRLRPAGAYVFGLIDRWARLASHAPRLANFFTQTAPFAAFAKSVAGIAPQRRITPFATQPFERWFRTRPQPAGDGPRVLLWPDTFNNYFRPDVAKAAVEVLEHAGWRVALPDAHLCCGRPLYEFGMLERARRYLSTIMETLADDIRAGTPIVALEPACASVFREELLNLFPYHLQARRLSGQVQLLADFLTRDDVHADFPALGGKALLHGHCHHKALSDLHTERKLLDALGLQVQLPDSGCCGMAGAFGFAADKVDVSLACGERVLLPAVRALADDALVVADGFSCSEQIGHGAGRQALHLAQVLRMALHGRPS